MRPVWCGRARYDRFARWKDIPHRAPKAGYDILARELVALSPAADRAVNAVDHDGARLEVDDPDQGHGHFLVVVQLLLE